MHAPRATAPPPGGWADVERMLDEAAALVRADLPPAAIDAAFLNRLCRGARAAGAAIWEVTEPPAEGTGSSEPGRPEPTVERGAVSGALAERLEHPALIRAVAGRPPGLTPPGGGASLPGEAANDTGFVLVHCPIAESGGEPGATAATVLEAAFLPEEVGGGEALALEAVRAFAEILEEGRTRREVARLRGELQRQRRAAAFAARLHAAGELAATERVLVDDGRAAAGVDRLAAAAPAVGWLGGRGVRVRAVSDAAVLDRRAGAVRSLEQLAAAALKAAPAAGRDGFSSSEDSEALGGEPPEPRDAPRRARRAARRMRAAFADHLAECGAAATAVVALRDPAAPRRRPLGVLIADVFPSTLEEDDELAPGDPAAIAAGAITTGGADPAAALAALAPHAGAALARARAARRGPLGRLWRWLTAPLRRARLPWTVPLAVAVVAGLAAAVFVPAPFDVTARGRLVPVVSRDVFAPRDGIVRELRVRHDSPVEKGQTLAVLVDPTLELRAEELAGEADAAEQRLAAVRAERAAGASAAANGSAAPDGAAGRLAAEERELVERLDHLAAQARLLDAQQAELTVVSPIAGRVLTWGLVDRLPGRPVPRGARLMTVAQVDGPWRLELFVPDRAAGPLLDAARQARLAAAEREANGEEREAEGAAIALPVTYLLAADPGPTYRTVADRIDPTVEPHAAGPAGAGGVEPSVRVFAPAPRAGDAAGALPEVRAGATVVARIRCGDRAIGYVWLHELIDSARTRFWW